MTTRKKTNYQSIEELKAEVKPLLISVNGMTPRQADYKLRNTDRETLLVWLNELSAEKEAEAVSNNVLDLQRETFRKIETVGDLHKWLTFIKEETKLSMDTPIKMFSDEEGNRVNGILCIQLLDIGLTIIPLEE